MMRQETNKKQRSKGDRIIKKKVRKKMKRRRKMRRGKGRAKGE